MALTVVFEGEVTDLPFNPMKYQSPFGRPLAVARGDGLSKLDEAKEWLEACLGLVEGNGPPNWDGIREFLRG